MRNVSVKPSVEVDSIPNNPDSVEKNATPETNRILDMYKDSTILITGGTGFLGKVLLEKALRCLDVRKIFILIRRKEGLSADERLVKLLQDAIFEKARNCYRNEGELLAKLEAVQIDLESDRLCQCATETEARLLEQTEIIFNVLASVKFNETIRNALRTNVAGTRKVLQLAQRMQRLRSVVHVSTLYSNCQRTEIEEKVYQDIPMGYGAILQLADTLSEQEMDNFQHCFLGPMPNTYTFSKKCAEVMIQDEFSHLPIGIFRPPIVISTYREPLPGWTDNLNGPSGVCMWTAKGLIRTIWGSATKTANLVPVDYCVNAIIVAAFDIRQRHWQNKLQYDNSVHEMEATQHDDKNCFSCAVREQQDKHIPTQQDGELPMYNFMYPEHSLTWGRYMEMASLGFDSRLHQLVWNYSYVITSYRHVFRLLSFCFHTVPAIILDTVRKIRRKKPVYQRAMQKTNRFLEMMSYFGLRQWTIRNGNVRRMRTLLSREETRLLEFDMAAIDWNEYFGSYIPGIRRYWFGECTVQGDRRVPAANRRFRYMQRLFHRLVWIWIWVRLTRLTSKFVLHNLFAILIA
ncbi:fatty acyl-CoA reductase wat-like [Topomyia yanbarensis]|uniref:fatty acyl-CoA reductase wat-like n=1 Tax=Topomyia yanbarensis TaxID=2498891 RepID=UPI00273BAA66|nr:fatty acyl-CoA reductase wat-like [Topomyia yanbarensis]